MQQEKRTAGSILRSVQAARGRPRLLYTLSHSPSGPQQSQPQKPSQAAAAASSSPAGGPVLNLAPAAAGGALPCWRYGGQHRKSSCRVCQAGQAKEQGNRPTSHTVLSAQGRARVHDFAYPHGCRVSS